MSDLRSLFGRSRGEIWEQLSREIGAEYREEGFFQTGMVILSHKEWEITLDTYAVHTGKSTIVYPDARPLRHPGRFPLQHLSQERLQLDRETVRREGYRGGRSVLP